MKVQSKLEKSDVEKIIGEPIINFSVAPGAKEGDNVAGNLLAIKVTTTSCKNLDLVYKCFPDDNGNQEQFNYVKEFGIFRTETCMYEKIFPRIKELLSKRENVKEMPVVKYISGFNDDQHDYVCMEDVRPEGFIMQDKHNSLTLAEVTLVMKEMARFHATTYFLLRYDGERMFEEDSRLHGIKYNFLKMENPMMQEMGSKMFFSYIENTVELLESRDKALAEHVRKFIQQNDRHNIQKLMRFNSHRTDKTAFACIIHGDLWTNNVLFKYAKNGDRDTPIELKFIDFQLSRRGNIFEDLGYFFWTSTTPEFRKHNLDTMLCEYYESFEESLIHIDFPKPENFTRGFLLDEFYKGILPAYIYMPFALSLQMGDLQYLHTDGAKNEDKTEHNGSEENHNSAPPAFDLSKMIEKNKRLMKLRMINSPTAMQRLEDLTREAIERKALQ